jgi:glyoxylase-like metal-dependent hydrolase (beta-lactamase superfamily II)
MTDTLKVQAFALNDFAENTYLLYDSSLECVIIDPGCSNANEQKIISSFIKNNALKPVKLINTHCHIDHILGVDFIKSTYQLKLGIHPLEEAVMLAGAEYSRLWNINYTPATHDYFINEGDQIMFGNGQLLDVLFTPGHSPGSICFYNKANDLVIGGDVLFRQSVGRWDLPGGNQATLLNSIREQLLTLPDHTTVYCGHGTPTTIGHERAHNPFIN